MKNAYKILTTHHTRDGTIVEVVYKLENILGKQDHRETWRNYGILNLYSSGNHCESRPQHFTIRLRVSVIALCNPRKLLGYKNSIKARYFPSISYLIYPPSNMIIKLRLYKHDFTLFYYYQIDTQISCSFT